MDTASAPASLGRLWTVAASMRRVLARVEELGKSDASVLVQGETGTGKELVAEALHEASARASGPLVVVDCASIPRELIETELFGHVRGSFTGAQSDRPGAFEAASGGTLFIDELGELPLDLQPRLLRVLEKQEVRRVGGNQVRRVDVRIVAATNRDLAREVAEGRFREDLYYRLAVVRLELPSLRSRPEDVVFLAERFLAEAGAGAPLALTEATRARLLEHRWPGNVRELRNVVERGAALSDSMFRLPDDFGEDLLEVDGASGRAPGSGVGLQAPPRTAPAPHAEVPAAPAAAAAPGDRTRPLWEGKTYKDARDAVLEDFERGWLAALLDAHRGNVSAAAREAGLHRNLVHRMMARLGIHR
jgi:DNA-binding NtrC family response regulator